MSNMSTLKSEVETATTGLLDRVTAREARIQHRNIRGSFEAGQQTTHKMFFGSAATITKVRTFVTKALAGTDAGTVTLNNSAGSAMANGAVSHAASSAVGFEGTATVPTTNNTVTAGSHIQIVTAKATAGGEVEIEIEFTSP